MEKETYQKLAADYLGLEEYISRLSLYRPQGQIRLKNQLKDVAILFYAIPVPILFMLPYLIMSNIEALRVFDAILFFAKGFAIFGGITLVICVIITIVIVKPKELVKMLGTLLFLPLVNARRLKADQRNEEALDYALRAKAKLREALCAYNSSSPGALPYFFEVDVPPDGMARRSRSVTYGMTHYFSDACTTGIYGNLRMTQKSGETVLGGFEPAASCTPKDLTNLARSCVWLYRGPELKKNGSKLTVYHIREIIQLQNSRTSSTVKTVTYDVEKAVNDFRRDFSMAEASGLLGSNYGAAAVAADKAEKKLRSSLAPEVTTVARSRQCTGEQLIMLDKGLVVYCENKVVGICLPKAVNNVFLAYQFFEPVRLKSGEFFANIPKEKKYHGPVVDYSAQGTLPNHYATVDYIVDYLGKDLPPLDLESTLPDRGLDPLLWCYWIRRRFIRSGGRVWNQKDCDRLLKQGAEPASPLSAVR